MARVPHPGARGSFSGKNEFAPRKAVFLEREQDLAPDTRDATSTAPESYGRTANAIVGLVMPPNFAFMFVLPVAIAVTKPLALMVATPGFEEVHVTLLVRF
jgi:hypothetical protein